MLLTHDDVREYLVDTCAEDNELLDDIDFTPSQIKLAMKMAANAFNELPPFTLVVEGHNMPCSEWAMLAVQEQLYRMRLNQLERNAFQYQAGNTSFDEDSTRITNLKAALQRIADWRSAARSLKVARNVSNSYGGSY